MSSYRSSPQSSPQTNYAVLVGILSISSTSIALFDLYLFAVGLM